MHKDLPWGALPLSLKRLTHPLPNGCLPQGTLLLCLRRCIHLLQVVQWQRNRLPVPEMTERVHTHIYAQTHTSLRLAIPGDVCNIMVFTSSNPPLLCSIKERGIQTPDKMVILRHYSSIF